MLTRAERDLLSVLADLDQVKAAADEMARQYPSDKLKPLIDHVYHSDADLLEVVKSGLDFIRASKTQI